MKRINSYLTFDGNCRDAMLFYKDCFGGELMLQTVGESPLGEEIPRGMSHFILHSALTNESRGLMGSDMVPGTGLVRGNAVSLALECVSEEELRTCYRKLSSLGSGDYPPEETFWGALFGGLTDRFGNHWLLNYDRGLNGL